MPQGDETAHDTHVTVERSLDRPVQAQLLNAGLTVGLGALGGTFLYYGLHSDAVTDADRKGAIANDAIGVGSLVVALVPLSFFIANFARASDSAAIETGNATRVTRTEWSACGSQDLGDVQVTLEVAGEKRTATTDPAGEAVFDLSNIQHPKSDPSSATLEFSTTEGKRSETLSVDLSKSPIAARWREGQEEKRVAAQAAKQAVVRAAGTLDSWARKSIVVTVTVKAFSEDHCFNGVDYPVPCAGAAARRKETKSWTEYHINLANKSNSKMACTVEDPDQIAAEQWSKTMRNIDPTWDEQGKPLMKALGLLPAASDLVILEPLKSHAFDSSGTNLLAAALVDPFIICALVPDDAMAVGAIPNDAALSARPVFVGLQAGAKGVSSRVYGLGGQVCTSDGGSFRCE